MKSKIDLSEFDKIKEFVENKFKCSAHDLHHVKRVQAICIEIAKGYEVNWDVLIPAVLLHDIARAEVDTNNMQRCHAIEGGKIAAQFLNEIGYNKKEIEDIRHCIESHRFRSSVKPNTIEAMILFDADKIDGLGAIGLARSFAMTGKYGESLYEKFERDKVEEYMRETDEKHAPNVEFQIKYKKMSSQLYTNNAKFIASERIKFMEFFFDQLDSEVNNL